MLISFIVNLSNKDHFLDLLEKIDALVLYIKIQFKYKLAAAYRWSLNTGAWSLIQVAMYLDTFTL